VAMMICSLSRNSNLASRVQDERKRRRINLTEVIMHPAGRCRTAHAGTAGSRKLILSVLRFNFQRANRPPPF